jgi:hypothetical protein
MFLQQSASTALKTLNLAAIGLAILRIFTDDTVTVTGTTLTIAANLTQLFASSTLTTSIAGFTNCVSAINLLYQPASIAQGFNFAVQITNVTANTLFGINKKFTPPDTEIAAPDERQSLINGR